MAVFAIWKPDPAARGFVPHRGHGRRRFPRPFSRQEIYTRDPHGSLFI